MLKIQNERYNVSFKANKKRQNELQIALNQKKRKENYLTCSLILDSIVKISEIFHDYQQDYDSQEINPQVFNEIMDIFIEDKAFLNVKTFRHPDSIENFKKEDENKVKIVKKNFSNLIKIKETIETKKFLAEKMLEDYIQGKNSWEPFHNFEEPKDLVEDEKYIPNKSINNYYLGNAIHSIINNKYKIEIKCEENKSIFLALKVSIIGNTFSGKESVGKFLKEKFGVELIFVEKLIEEIVKNYEVILIYFYIFFKKLD